jgi:hypothetical protein
MLGFGARYQDVLVDYKVTAVKMRRSEKIGDRLARRAPLAEYLETPRFLRRRLCVAVRDEPLPVASEDMAEQKSRVGARRFTATIERAMTTCQQRVD